MAKYSECINEIANALAEMKRCANDPTNLVEAGRVVSELWERYDKIVADLEQHVRAHGC